MNEREAEQEVCRACGAFLRFKGFDLIWLADEADRPAIHKAVDDLVSEMSRRADGTLGPHPFRKQA